MPGTDVLSFPQSDPVLRNRESLPSDDDMTLRP
jgi:hypothetical protein